MTTVAYIYVTLTMYWLTPTCELAAGPEIRVYRDDRQQAQVEPLTLTWTPTEGFGAQTQVTLSP